MYFDIYYKSYAGKTLSLVTEPYRMQTADLFDYAWDPYTESGYITAFEKSVVTKEVTLTVTAGSEREYHEAINNFYEIVELDVLNMTPGRLYFGTQYMNCYIAASEKTEWESGVEQLDIVLQIVTDHPEWIQEVEYKFKAAEAVSTDNKRYTNKYSYRYANGLTSLYIQNEHFHDANFLMRVYGPCVNPMVVIDGLPYLVYIVLEEKEYLEINSREGTIIKTMAAGQKVNCFHNRAKGEDSVFHKISSGRKPVSWPGKFDFDLILYQERGEPRWQ